MLSSVSWAQFFLFAGGATLIWVLYVLRGHILGRHPKQPGTEADESPPGKRVWSVREEPVAAPKDPAGFSSPNHEPFMPRVNKGGYFDQPPLDDPTEIEEDDSDYQALENLAMEISELTTKLGITTTEEQLLEALKETIERYPTVNTPPLQSSINQLIIRCSLQDCGITLSLQSIEALWS